MLNSLLKGVSIEHCYQLKIKYNLTFGFNFISKLYLGDAHLVILFLVLHIFH